MTYLWLKALHVAAVVLWVGGTLAMAGFLARAGRLGAGRKALAREVGWANAIAISPAEGVVWLIGIYMIIDAGWWPEGWLLVKLAAAAGVAALRGMLAGRIRRAAAGEGEEGNEGDAARDAGFGAIALVVLLLCLLTAAAMVVVKPL